MTKQAYGNTNQTEGTMTPQITLTDYLFAVLIIAAGIFCMRALLENIRFLTEEIRAPLLLDVSKLPDKRRSFFLMVLWIVLSAFFFGTAAVLFSDPGRIISGAYTPDMYGWLAGVVLLTAAAACVMLVYRYYILWSRFDR